MLDGLHRRRGEEVDVGDEGLRESGRAETAMDVSERDGGRLVGGGDADDLAAGLGQADALGQGRRHVLRVGGRHRLQTEGVPASDAHAAARDLAEARDAVVG